MRPNLAGVLAAAMVALAVLSVTPRAAEGQATWSVSVVAGDGPYNVGDASVSLALDAGGAPHVAYYNGTNTALEYARWTGAAWARETVYSMGDPGRYASLRLDVDGKAHVSFYAGTDLAYANNTAGTWTTVPSVDLPGDVGRFTSLALRDGRWPRISYYDATNTALKVATWNGTWTAVTVDSAGDVGRYSSLGLDAAGNPHVAYYDLTNSALKHAWWDGASWWNEAVDAVGSVGRYCSLAVDASDRVHVSYATETGAFALKHAVKAGASWTLETVDATPDVGWHTSIAIDPAGLPRIGYYDVGNGTLKYAASDGVAWTTEVADDAGLVGDVGWYASIAVDGLGNPAIAYWDAVDRDVRLARAWIDYVDLAVMPGDVSTAPAGPVANGTAVTVRATVRNVGNLDAATVEVEFFDGDPALGLQIDGTQTVPALPALGSANVSVPWTAAPAGPHRLCVVADPAGLVAESSEVNNEACVDLVVLGADLAVDPGDLRVVPAPPLALGAPATVEATVRNVGVDAASGILVRFSDGDPAVPANWIGEQVIPGLAPGADAIASVGWTPATAGDHTLHVVVDPADAIPESDEGNNTASIVVPVAAPDLSVADLAASPPGPVLVASPVLLTAAVANGGAGDLTANVTFYEDGDGDRLVGPEELVRLAVDVTVPGNGTASPTATWSPTVLGTREVCAWVDREGRVPDGNRTNDQRCIAVAVFGKPDYAPVEPMPSSTVQTGIGMAVALSVKVANLGNATANATAVLAFYNETTPGSPFHTATIPPLGAGNTSAVFPATWPGVPTSGTYRVAARADFSGALDEWDEGNNAYTWTIEIAGGPMTTLVYGTPRNGTAPVFVTSATPLSLSAQDFSGSGIRYTRYQIDGAGWALYTAPFTLSGEGPHAVEFYSEDNLGNVESINAAAPVVDDTPPSSSVAFGSPSYLVGGTWIGPSTPVTLAAVDGPAQAVGLDRIAYRVWDGVSWTAWATYGTPLAFPLEASYAMEYSATDGLGNAEAVSIVTFVVDATPPTPLVDFLNPIVAGTPPWISGATPVSVDAVDGGASPVGVASVAYRVWRQGTWGGWTAAPAGFPLGGPDGLAHVEARAADHLGNQETTNASAIVDASPPETTVDVGVPRHAGAYVFVTPSTPFTLPALDAGPDAVGLLETTYRIWRGGWSPWAAFVVPLTLGAGDGLAHLEYASEDLLGNREAVGNATFVVDGTDPMLDVRIDGLTFLAANGTFFAAGNATLVLTAADPGTWASGLDLVEYAFDSGAWTPVPGPVSLGSLAHGMHRVDARAADHLGHAVAVEVLFFLDAIAPRTTPEVQGTEDAASLLLTAIDDGSGVNGTFYSLDGGAWRRYEGAIPVPPGVHVVEYYSRDRIGNVEAVQEYPFTVAGPAAPPGVNAKPLLAAIFTALLVGLGFLLARRTKSRRLFAWATAFAIAEAASGVVSLALPALAIPPVLGAGLVVDLGILVAGVAALWTLTRRAPEPDVPSEREEGEEPDA